MEQNIFELRVTNKAKDQVIEHFRDERKEIIDQLLNASRRVGELETKLLQLSPPGDDNAGLEGRVKAGDAVTSPGNGQIGNPI